MSVGTRGEPHTPPTEETPQAGSQDPQVRVCVCQLTLSGHTNAGENQNCLLMTVQIYSPGVYGKEGDLGLTSPISLRMLPGSSAAQTFQLMATQAGLSTGPLHTKWGLKARSF